MSNGPSRRYQPDATVVKDGSYRWAAIKLAVALLAVVGVAVYGSVGSGINLGDAGIERATVEQAVIERINDARQQQGLPALSHNQRLSDRSRGYSSEMAAAGALEHGSVACSPSGENIAQTHYQTPIETDSGSKTYETSEELGIGIAEQWLNSPGHRENIMSPQFSAVGVGVVKTDSKIWATQRFCG